MGIVGTVGHRLGAFRQAFEFLGVSLWIAWVLLVYSGEFYWTTDNVYFHTTLNYLISTVCISLTFLAAGAAPARMERVVFDNRIVVGAGAAASIATLGMVFLGRPVGLFPVLAASAAIAGAGTGIVALRACLLMGELSARNSFIVSAGTLLLAFTLYLAVLSLPHAVGTAALLALPFMAGLHICLHRSGEEPPEREQAESPRLAPLLRITAALFVLAVVFSLSRGMYPNGLGISDFNDSRNFAACGSMVFCFAMLVLSLVLPQGTSFGQLGYWMVVAIVFLMAVFPVLGAGSAESGVVSTVANSALGMTAWALFGAVSSLSRLSPLRVYGLGFAAFMLGSAVGWPVGYAVNIQDLGVNQYYAGFALLIVVFLVVLALFRQGDLVRMIRPDGDQEPTVVAPTALDEPAHPSAAVAAAPAGKADQGPVEASKQGASEKERLAAIMRDCALTDREKDVLVLLAKGLNARTVSDALGFSYNTARVHVRNIYRKLDVHSRSELLGLLSQGR